MDKRITFIAVSLLWLALQSFAQISKPAMPLTGASNWCALGQSEINKDGRYVLFTIQNESENPIFPKETLIIKPISKKWERKYTGATGGQFSKDGKYAFFCKTDGKHYQLNLDLNREEQRNEMDPVSLLKKETLNVYQSKTNSQWLIVEDRNTGQKDSLENIYDYIFRPAEDGIVAVKLADNLESSLVWYNVKFKKEKLLWHGRGKVKIDPNKSSKYVFFKVVESLPTIDHRMPEVDVWGYKDANYPNPFKERKTETEYNYCINTYKLHASQLTTKNERIYSIKGDYAIIEENQAADSPTEKFWNEKARSSYYLYSLGDGSRKLIVKELKDGLSLSFSPDARFIIISDQDKLRYFSYDTQTGIRNNISKDNEIFLRGASYVDVKFLDSEFIFLPGDYLVVRDEYDLWKLDLKGNKKPINLTNNFGRENQIVFRSFKIKCGQDEDRFPKERNSYLLNAFDEKTKSWGFYKISNLIGEKPTKLNIGSYYYGGENPEIKRAESVHVYLVRRESVSESINLYVTTDFKSFTMLSNIQPEKDYNWMTVDLIHWETQTGKLRDGLLYKPENFDKKNRYPVVTIIYNEYSSKKNRFLGFKTDEFGYVSFLPVAWLISNGYLVFIPDLDKRKPGDFLKESYNMLIPGVEYIASLPYVDSKKIGLQGASWGGMQTDYIITQTNLFTAAFSGAAFTEYISRPGFSDQISQDYNMPGKDLHFGGLLTDVPESYISQSPLFYANKVVTPLLIRHNKLDGVPFYQGLQFFRLLRRLGKKSWLLQYDNEGHGVNPGKNLNDMNLRIAQFFDHYLKDKPAPKWMTQGIAPEYKQIDSGLELDLPNVIP